ncbi:LLM class F420-dependent oxidoreductase [Streptomyces sp. NPDC020681]|uniref:LLM class F420-dependent oxidoreductase n=1 Tax=Streptomyces sp. NPDC020681 TaxID=3365083 RepID=UPI0037AED8DF
MAGPFRFSVNMLTPTGGEEWRKKCRRAEELGYDVIQVPDHLGMMAPFPALVAAAAVTERPRLGTFVLNAGFWNPTLLAREIATADVLTGGRLEVGIGAGYVKEEHDRAGLEFLAPGGRVGHLRRTVEELKRLLADDGHLPKAVQRPGPPLLIGGNGDRVLRLAVEHADVVAFTGARESKDGLKVLTGEELDGRIAAYRKAAAGRADEQELNLLIQFVAVTDDREAAVRDLLPLAPHLSAEQVLQLPLLAVGTVGQIADQLRAQRERYGFSYISVLDPYLETFGPVIEELRGS